MLDASAVLFFWLPLGVIFYHWVLYPLTLWLFAELRPRRTVRQDRDKPFSVSIIIAAFNEEKLVADKLTNCLELDYPAERMEILVGSDASTDSTDAIVASFADPRIKLFRYEPQSGKIPTQNRLLEEARGNLVLLTDVDTTISRESLALMVEHMRDPRVAVVSPNYARVNASGSAAEGFYDRWEARVKELEGRLGAMVGAYGWALLLRREFAQPIPADTVLDDFVLAIRPFRQGYDAVTEPRARVVTSTESETIEFGRKVRISRGNVQALCRFGDLLLPTYGIKAWVYFSHKVLRMLVPFLLLSMLVASALRVSSSLFGILFVLQSLCLATIPLLLVTRGLLRKLLIPQYYYLMNIALMVGYWRYLLTQDRHWARTPRGVSRG